MNMKEPSYVLTSQILNHHLPSEMLSDLKEYKLQPRKQ